MIFYVTIIEYLIRANISVYQTHLQREINDRA